MSFGGIFDSAIGGGSSLLDTGLDVGTNLVEKSMESALNITKSMFLKYYEQYKNQILLIGGGYFLWKTGYWRNVLNMVTSAQDSVSDYLGLD